MRTVHLSIDLAAPADVVWSAVKTPQAFVHVSGSMLRYPAAERLERPWRTGDAIVGWTLLGGVIPFSRHRLRVEQIDDEQRVMATKEGGGVVRRWDHVLTTTYLNGGRCRYEDHLTIDAGAMTPAVVLFATAFFRYRQRRWRRLANLLAATSGRITQAAGGLPQAPGPDQTGPERGHQT